MTTTQPATATLTIHGGVEEVIALAARLQLPHLLAQSVAATIPVSPAPLAPSAPAEVAEASTLAPSAAAPLAPVLPVEESTPAPLESPRSSPELVQPELTWGGVTPTTGKRVAVTFLATGEVKEGNVREVDADRRRFTFGTWGGPEHIAADGRTTWAPVPCSYPPGLTTTRYELHKKELRAKKVPLAQISPWRTYDEILAGTWSPPPETPSSEAKPEDQAPIEGSSAPIEGSSGGPALPAVGSVIAVMDPGLKISIQGIVVGLTQDGFQLCSVGEIPRDFRAVETTWTPAEPYAWTNPALGDEVEVHNGGRPNRGVVSQPGLTDPWGHPGFEYTPAGTKVAQKAFYGRYGVTIIQPEPKTEPAPLAAPAVLPSTAPLAPPPAVPVATIQAPAAWTSAEPLEGTPNSGTQALAWLDHGGWPATGPGRLDTVTVLALAGQEVMVQLSTGGTATVNIFDLRKAA